MKIDINDIPREGVSLKLTEKEGAFSNILCENGYGFNLFSPVTSCLTIKKENMAIVVEGSAKATVKKVCSRCLKEFEEEGDWKIASTFTIHGDESLEIDRILDPSPLQGDELDITEIIREQLALWMPMKSLCKDDCKGLCAKCGADLNEGTCECFKEKDIDPRLAILKNIKIE